MTAMLDRPAAVAGLPVPQTTPPKPRKPRRRKPWSSFYDEEVVARVLARAEGRSTWPIRELTDEEKVAVARYYLDRGRGTTAIARALHVNGPAAVQLAETARLDQILDTFDQEQSWPYL